MFSADGIMPLMARQQARNNGKGLTVDTEESIGYSFGWRLIKALTRKLRGKLDFESGEGLLVRFGISEGNRG